MTRRTRSECGQASVELVALLPLIVLLAALLVQGALAGWAAWSAGTAARAAARAQAVGQPPLAAARASVPRRLRAAVRITVDEDGEVVRARVRVPSLVRGLEPGAVTAAARFTAQAAGS